MATAKGYISAKLASFSFAMDAETLEAHLAEADIDADALYTKNNAVAINAVLVGIIPELLAMPDISEDSFSIKRNVAGIREYVRLLCDKYGIAFPFPDDDLIFNASNIW